MSDAVRTVGVQRVHEGVSVSGEDEVAAEQPLEVRLEGLSFAVIMRTPGADDDLAVGFLFTEGVLRGGDDVRQVEADEIPDVVNVRLSRSRAEILPDLFDRHRQVTTNASCGLCGRRSLDSLAVEGAPLPVRWSVGGDVVSALPARLRRVQGAFDRTGGLHAAALFGRDGELQISAEDIGRHNAVDKLLGRMVRERRVPLRDSLLVVSGRASFEIVQKAFAGGIPLVAAVSAPSSLAVELAERSGVTLLAFVREGRFTVYAHGDRVGIGATSSQS